jgi:hypothetical protein
LEEAEIERLIGGPPRLAIEDIVRHPRFAEAGRHYVDSFLDVYGDDPLYGCSSNPAGFAST